MNQGQKKALFAGGCFWCMQSAFDRLDGVTSTVVGYTGGVVKDPTYSKVSEGETGHAEAIEIIYDPSKVSYEKILDVFWHHIDPTTVNRQFADAGSQYRSVIFYEDDEQKAAAEASKRQLIESGRVKQVVTEITQATVFYPAEEYHQEYYKKHPLRYQSYCYLSGRDQRLEEIWGSSNV